MLADVIIYSRQYLTEAVSLSVPSVPAFELQCEECDHGLLRGNILRFLLPIPLWQSKQITIILLIKIGYYLPSSWKYPLAYSGNLLCVHAERGIEGRGQCERGKGGREGEGKERGRGRTGGEGKEEGRGKERRRRVKEGKERRRRVKEGKERRRRVKEGKERGKEDEEGGGGKERRKGEEGKGRRGRGGGRGWGRGGEGEGEGDGGGGRGRRKEGCVGGGGWWGKGEGEEDNSGDLTKAPCMLLKWNYSAVAIT